MIKKKQINLEEMYQSIQKQNWDYPISVLQNYKEDIAVDTSLQQAAKILILEFLRNIDSYPKTRTDINENLEKLWIIGKSNYYKFEPDELKSITCQIVKRKPLSVGTYNLAKHYPDEFICKQAIDIYENQIPKNLEHSQSNRIKVTESKVVVNIDFTINLFKSDQEIEFFYALKRTFEMYQIYPNVAISCLLNWELIKNDLDNEERKYFFSGIIDFVIFDQATGFKPLHFFELDSAYHDNPDIQKKDKMKDSILAKAGVKIMRIRKNDKHVSEQEFIKLIRELVNRK